MLRVKFKKGYRIHAIMDGEVRTICGMNAVISRRRTDVVTCRYCLERLDNDIQSDTQEGWPHSRS